MKKTCLILFKICLISFLQNAHAQLKAIKVDSITGVPTEALPFDQSFVLKIPVSKNAQISAVEYVPLIRRKKVGESVSAHIKRNVFSHSYAIPKIESKYFHYSTEDNIRYLNVTFPVEHFLKPSRNYAFILNQFTHDEFEMFMSYHNHKITSNLVELNKAKAFYDKLRAKEQKTFEDENFLYNFEGSKNDSLLKRVDEIYLGKQGETVVQGWPLVPDFTAYNLNEAALNAYIGGLGTLTLFSGTISLKALMDFVSGIDPSINIEFKKKYFIEDNALLNKIILLYNLSAIDYTNLLNGRISLDAGNDKVLNESEIINRQENIKKTKKSLKDIQKLADLLNSRGIAQMNVVSTNITTFLGHLNGSDANINAMVQSYRSIEGKLIERGYLDATLIKGGNTYTYNFSTRNSLSIAPDFGLVTTRIGNDGNNPYSFVPYLGFHVNIRPLNRDVPFRSYKKTLINRISLLAGFSLVDISNGPKGTANLQADSTRSFFKSSTLLTGIGFRLSNVARITFGTMWYFKYVRDTNQLNTTYIYKDRSLNFWPFIGLTIDLTPKSIFEGFEKFETHLTNSPRNFTAPTPATP